MKLDLRLGTQIICMDQSSGKLVAIGVDPATKQATDLVVQNGLLSKQTWVVPLAAVERATGHALYLHLSNDQLTTYPEFGTGRPVLSAKTAIRTEQGDFATLEHVVVDGVSGHITHLVVRKGFFGKHFLIPQEAIAQISDDAILVALHSDEIAALPQVQDRRDEDILAELQRRLQEGWPAFTGVMATCEAGSVRLVGYVRSKPLWYHAAELAQLVDGVNDVQNDLVVNSDFVPGDGETTVDLARQVHHALLNDPRTATAVIDVISERDTILLQGKVDNEEIRRSAEEITLQQPGVTAVDNRLAITQVGSAPKLNYG